MGWLFIFTPALAQTPPPRSGIFRFFFTNSTVNKPPGKEVKVIVQWQEKGLTKTVEYYDVLRDLSTP